MVLVDQSSGAKHAMMWPLTHVANKGDFLTLLHVLPQGSCRGRGEDASEPTNSLGKLCKPEVNEALKLANQLIPSVPRDVKDTHMVLAKEKIVVDEPRFLRQFFRDILPVLIKAVNSGADSYICYGCASIVNNICYFSKTQMLQGLLKEKNIPSFLAGLLSRKDHHVLISSLKIIEILMQNLPDAYLGSFIKEGVVYAVETLLMQEESRPHLSDDTEQSEK